MPRMTGPDCAVMCNLKNTLFLSIYIEREGEDRKEAEREAQGA